MPKSDTWPGGTAMESGTGMDSAGSCDSVLSIGSACSDDSLEHLSAEERACLMFLEETIESLEVEDDSGLSNDEPERLTNGLAREGPHQTSVKKPAEILVQLESKKSTERDHKPSRLPTPPVGAGGNAKEPALTIDAPDGFRSSSGLEQSLSSNTTDDDDDDVDVVDMPPSFIPEPPTKTSLPSEDQANEGVATSIDPGAVQKTQNTSDMSLGLIPPPSDFMDEPVMEPSSLFQSFVPPPVFEEPPEWTPELPKKEAQNSSVEVSVEPSPSGNKLEDLTKKPSATKSLALTPLTMGHPDADKPLTPSPTHDLASGSKDHNDHKIPPMVAPKPKNPKLPPNIILKSHKDTNAVSTQGFRTQNAPMDQQKVHLQALKKLGLLKSEETESSPGVSPAQSPTFKAKDPLSSPNNQSLSTAAPEEPSPKQPKHTESLTDVLSQSEKLKSRVAVSREGSMKREPARSQEARSPGLASQSSDPDKSNVELSPGQLRKNRAQSLPAGSVRTFAIDNSSKLLPAASCLPIGETQKLPRSSGISVQISPNSANGENRREALKKLGLLKD